MNLGKKFFSANLFDMTIIVSVLPRSSQASVTRLADGSYKVKLTAAPVDGEANRQLLEVLAKHFGVPKRAIEIEKGQTRKRKRVFIRKA